ncbi:oxaloacetate decarboxylase gamma chain [Marinomonas gallaica]|mgnify:CR=1 FL=1|uniref:Probable oxaloacetate decarboxylase gamma chain n=1 Tax=Marinomonas gallaica TaxID=1806667 RepID=A0A1C3JQ24_9GAMM|nr:OadG family transporter subunit [Marinomonas gallaica]SBT17226.1 oxaloacetate decarboxylase gamma chain [Marinomonas gallaica]SBT19561.1 oxaloacetate decarboxylase gamma chain [Marinomonas gallaica]
MNNLMSDGFGLMLLGMGFVFTFLCLLIVSTTYMSKLINRYFPEAAPVAKKPMAAPTAGASSASASATDPKIAAAITAAIHQHRNR